MKDGATNKCLQMVQEDSTKKESELSQEISAFIDDPQSFADLLGKLKKPDDQSFVNGVCKLEDLKREEDREGRSEKVNESGEVR